jgi:hypothetical protein
MDTMETVTQDRRHRLAVRARIEELEAGAMDGSQDQYPPVSGAKALVREQSRHLATKPAPETTEPARELSV